MERYKEYMDHIAVPNELHEKLMRPKTNPNLRVFGNLLISCACCMLVIGFVMMGSGGSSGETSGAVKETFAGMEASWEATVEPQEDGNAPEVQLTGAYQETANEAVVESGAGVESVVGNSGNEEDSKFPDWFVSYLPIMAEATYTEDKTENAKGVVCWAGCWQWTDHSFFITLAEGVGDGDMPIGSEYDWEAQTLWDEITEQLEEQFADANSERKDGMIALLLGRYEVSYTWNNMKSNEVLECFKTIPYLQ